MTVRADAPSASGRRLSATARRVREHVVLFLVAAAVIAVVAAVLPSNDWHFKLSMATAYSSLLLLVASLAIGPLNVLRDRPNPVSTNLRRDVGIWAGIVGLAHMGVGLTVHLRGHMERYFLDPNREGLWFPFRTDLFGFMNYTGLAAALILLLLLALSNDVSLRGLGTKRWKTLQRANYFGMAFTVMHGAGYQFVEKRQLPFVLIFGAQIALAIALQLAGYRRMREERPG